MTRRFAVVAAALIVLSGPLAETKASSLVLKLAWAKKYRNQLSIDASVTVLALNKGKETDGDSHGGSRVNAAGLPMVAEILNGTAPSQHTARAELAPGSDTKKHVYGAWRLWFEHPPAGGGIQCQSFGSHPPAICENQTLTGADSNPSHSFEIHPVFEVDGVPVGRSSMVLTDENNSVKDADDAFKEYTGKNKILMIVRSKSALTLTSIIIHDNYVRLHLRITHEKVATTRQEDGAVDGGFVRADILSSSGDGTALKEDARVFYFLDSAPGDALDAATVGDEFHVIGMPRINLDAVLKASEGKKSVSIPVPFEFVVVAMDTQGPPG